MKYICNKSKGCWQKKCLHINLHKRDPNHTYCDGHCMVADCDVECISISQIRKDKLIRLGDWENEIYL